MKATINIQNLKCDGCGSTIAKKLNGLHGISNVSVFLEKSQVTLDCESDLNLLDAKETLKKIGYPEIGEDNSLETKAKSYVSCAMGKMN